MLFRSHRDDGDGAGPAAARAWLTARSQEPGFLMDYPLRRIRAVRVAVATGTDGNDGAAGTAGA